MHTILGAGGSIGNELAAILAARDEPYRLVSRSQKPTAGGEWIAADLADREQTRRAIAGSGIVYLVAGLKYDIDVWRRLWPVIMSNVIDACARSQAKLLFFDNVYMYGKVRGVMTEETPYNPCSKKGEVRAQIATLLMNEVKAGNLTAMIARSADFYGPAIRNSVVNALVFEPLAKGAKPSCMGNPDVAHSLTFTPDAGKGVDRLAQCESAWNQVWHLPTAPDPPTVRQLIALAAREFGTRPDFRVLGKPLLRVVGWFNSNVRESYEMLYQNDSPYVFDSSKFAREFGDFATPYAEGIRKTASSYRQNA